MQDPTINRTKNGRVECTIVFDADEVTKAQEDAIKVLGEDVKIDGFRAGQAPADLLREKLDDGAIMEQTIKLLLPGAFDAIGAAEDIKPIAAPKVEAVEKDPLTIQIIFIERPEVKLKGVDKIKVEKTEPKVDDKDVDNMINYLLKQHETAIIVDKAAEEGDRVTMDFWAADPVSNEEIPEIRSEDYKVVIGSKTLLPGFEDQLIGHKAGSDVEFPITFPEKYHAEHLQNKLVTFHVAVKQVEKVTVPEMTDDVAKEKFGAESAKALRDEITQSMMLQEQQADARRREQLLFDALVKAATVELADELVEDEMHSLLSDFHTQLQQQGVSFEQFMEQTKQSVEDLQKDMKEKAASRITLRLALQQLVDDKNIELNDAEVSEKLTQYLAGAPDDKKADLEKEYAPGTPHYEQFTWQLKVEKVIAEMLEQ